jgi:hypothetical protein
VTRDFSRGFELLIASPLFPEESLLSWRSLSRDYGSEYPTGDTPHDGSPHDGSPLWALTLGDTTDTHGMGDSSMSRDHGTSHRVIMHNL